MGVNSLPKTFTRQRRGCDLNPGPSAPESSTLTTRLPSHPHAYTLYINVSVNVSSRFIQRIRGFAIMRCINLLLTLTLTFMYSVYA